MSTRTPETHHAVHPAALDRSLTQHLESELDEERRRGREVVDYDAHVFQALDRHVPDGRNTATQLYCARNQLLELAISSAPEGT
jgi:hypothetical protein